MTKVKIGINGLGRIGRTLVREFARRQHDPMLANLELVAVNNPGNKETYAHLLKHDSLHRHYNMKVELQGDELMIDGKKVYFFNEPKAELIDWDARGVQLVIDSTGIYKDREGLSKHLRGGVAKVVMCAPGKQLDGTFVMGINEHQFDPKKHHLISNASCTTNCLAPVVKVLNDAFEIEAGLMTTVHSYTNDQNLLDNSHSDLRRARAAALSMIPTTTGAAKALGEVIPSLAGKLDGYAVRVPTPDVSMVDLALRFKKTPTKAEVNDVLKRAASTQELRHILNFCEEELVSIDFMGSPYSSIVDAGLTNVVKDLVKVVAWYDNEIGFSNRVLELAAHVGKKTWL